MRSIRSIIFLRLFLSTLVLFTVVSGVAYFLSKDAIKQFVENDAATSLSFIVNNVKSNYQSDLAALDQISLMHGFLPYDEPVARTVVKNFLEFPSVFSTVHMYRADGPLLFAERRATMGPYGLKPNYNLKEPEFVAQAKRVIEEKHSLASTVFNSAKGTLFQTYITPVFSDEKKQQVFGILSGGVFPKLQRVDYLLRGLRLGQDNFILIYDNSGHVITSDGISEQDAGKWLKSHSDRAIQRFYGQPAPVPGQPAPGQPAPGQPGQTPIPVTKSVPGQSITPEITENVKVNKFSFIVISLPIDDLKLLVTMGVNQHRIDTKTKELSYRLLAVLVVGLLLSLFFSVLLGSRWASRFSQIAETINEINTGNFAARAQYQANDEIGYLSKSINALAVKIQKSEYLGNLWSNEEELNQEVTKETNKSDI